MLTCLCYDKLFYLTIKYFSRNGWYDVYVSGVYIFRQFKEYRGCFMNCKFSMQLHGKHKMFVKNKWNHMRGTHPSRLHKQWITISCKDEKKWALDFERIDALVFVYNNHWILVCVNFQIRTVEIYYYNKHVNIRHVNSFSITIPHLLK